tara:strand:- start:56 stop:460 length:405 start_codon:yes stop_codon:yes gene_type:complete
MSLSSIINNGLDAMVPNGITTSSTTTEIINIIKIDNISNAVMHQYYKIKKNVEFKSVGKEFLYPLNLSYKGTGSQPIYCGYSRQYFARIANGSHLFRKVLDLAFQYNYEIRRRASKRATGLELPVCGKLTGKCY